MPVGRSSSVAGSSFMQVRNTRAAPAATPGAASGSVTARSTPQRRAAQRPGDLLQHRRRLRTEARTAPTAAGRNSTA